MLNWAIAKHPLNWVIVFLMVVIGMFVLNLLLTPFMGGSADASPLSPNSEPVSQPFMQ